MIKSELVHRISDQKPQLYGREAEKVVNTILDEIAAALACGDRVELRGFGVFAIKFRQARKGRNPRSGWRSMCCAPAGRTPSTWPRPCWT